MNMLRLVLAAAGLALLSGCSMLPSLPSLPTEPWVKPYERERFADPVMNAQRDALAARHNSHVREVREGSRGAVAVQGGGCGCN
jgi:hypothetical protein